MSNEYFKSEMKYSNITFYILIFYNILIYYNII